MAITINPDNNTISGIAVGGLPNGIIDNDCFADGAVTAAKVATGQLTGISTSTGFVYNNTRTIISFPANTSPTVLTFTYNKSTTTSRILVYWCITCVGGTGSTCNSWTVEASHAGSSTTRTSEPVGGVIVPTNSYNNGQKSSVGSTIFTNMNQTGDWVIDVNVTNYGGTTNNPINILNPNSTDDTRITQNGSYLYVLEYEP